MFPKPVLLAEDNADDTALFQRLYEQARIANPLRIFDDGEGLLNYLVSDRLNFPLPAMVFLDLKMRRISGLEVLKFLGTKFKREFPAIILTGMEDLAQMRLAYELGAHSFLLKPLGTENFIAFMEKFKGIGVAKA